LSALKKAFPPLSLSPFTAPGNKEGEGKEKKGEEMSSYFPTFAPRALCHIGFCGEKKKKKKKGGGGEKKKGSLFYSYAQYRTYNPLKIDNR